MSVFGKFADFYDLLYKDKDYEAEAQCVSRLLSSHDGTLSTILNLGCGTGEQDVHFANQGTRVTGIDQSAEMLKHALARVASLGRYLPDKLEHVVLLKRSAFVLRTEDD